MIDSQWIRGKLGSQVNIEIGFRKKEDGGGRMLEGDETGKDMMLV